jgi:hypothetical protein
MIDRYALTPGICRLVDASPDFLVGVRTTVVDGDGHECRRQRSAGSIVRDDLPQHQRASSEDRTRSPTTGGSDTWTQRVEPGERVLIAGRHERPRASDSAGFGPALVFE